jgi:hypothetical protein
MKYVLSTIAILIICAVGASAQPTTSSKPKSITPNPAVRPAEKTDGKTSSSSSDWTKTWSVLVSLNTTFDSNLDHDTKPIRAAGLAPAVVAGYEMRSKRHRIRFISGLSGSRYTRSTDLNRVGQYFGSSYRLSLGRWSWETEGEAILKGTNDDRETNNQFIFTQKLGFRFDRKTRANVYFAYRLKRYALIDADRNSVNPMLGLKFSRRLGKKFEWELGYRYDENRAVSQRQRYIRSTYDTSIKYQATKKDSLKTGFSFRPRLYERTVRVGDVRVPRRDRKYSFDLAWQRQINRQIGFELGYGFEKQTSNDADKLYKNHQVGFSIFYHFGNGEVIEP